MGLSIVKLFSRHLLPQIESMNTNIRVEAFIFRVEAFIFRVEAFIFRVEAFTCRVEAFIFRVEAFIFRVEAFIFRVEAFIFQIRVNSVNPILVWTDMGKELFGDKQKVESMKTLIPLGKFAGQCYI